MSRPLRVACGAVLVVACSLSLRASTSADADLQFQLGTLLFNETRYWDALQAFDRATHTDDADLALRARKGKVRSALRVAEFAIARAEGEKLKTEAPRDPEALTLYADALWSAGLFDEADAEAHAALAIDPESGRARFGLARSLATRSRLPEALDEAQSASAVELAPCSSTSGGPAPSVV